MLPCLCSSTFNFDIMNSEQKEFPFQLSEQMSADQILNSHRRRKNFAPKELNIIISMVEENADLIYNRVNRNPKFVSKQDFWQTVTLMINEHCNFSAKRDIKEVRRKWVTFQSEVKSKARDGTNVLSQHEKRVYDLIQTHNQDVSVGEERLTMLPLSSAPNISPQLSEPDSPENIHSDIVSNITSNTVSNIMDSTGSSITSNMVGNITSNMVGNLSNPRDLKDVDVKVEIPSNDNSAELLMNICSQVMGGIPNSDLSYQVGSIKDMMSTSIPTSISTISDIIPTGIAPRVSSQNDIIRSSSAPTAFLQTSCVTPLLVAPVVATAAAIPSITPIRNVVPVQPVNHVPNFSKRSRLDIPERAVTSTERVLTSSLLNSSARGRFDFNRQPGGRQESDRTVQGGDLGVSDQVAIMLGELVEHQREGNRIALERLEVARQRMSLEQEKLEIEKARYEIEKERLCQEIITRKKT